MYKLSRKLLSYSLTIQFTFTFAAFLGIIYSINQIKLLPVDSSLLSAVAVLFGLYIGFLISSQRGRHNTFFNHNREESAKIYLIAKYAKLLAKNEADKLTGLLDDYMVAQMDYRLVDYHMTDSSFDLLFDYAINFQPKSKNGPDIKSSIVSALKEQQVQRYKFQSVVEDRVSRSEWFAVTALYLVMVYSFLLLNMPDNISKVLGALVCASITMVMSMLFKLSELQFNVQNKIWNPLSRLFESIGSTMYYPQPSIEHKLARPNVDRPYRVARYPNRYPDISGKVVELVEPK